MASLKDMTVTEEVEKMEALGWETEFIRDYLKKRWKQSQAAEGTNNMKKERKKNKHEAHLGFFHCTQCTMDT